MKPEDDPEARIRELERPLSDMARTSELGTGQYTGGWVPPTTPSGAYGAPPPPGAYGPHFVDTPRRSATGSRVGWFLFILLVAGVGMAGAVFAIFDTASFTSDDSPGARPSFEGSFTTLPGARPTMPGDKTGAPPISTAPPGGQLSVSGSGENKTIACDDGLVSVSGFSNTIVITGHCASLSVSGVENEVTLDSADAIVASGFDNRVTYRTGVPTVQTSGANNVVEQR